MRNKRKRQSILPMTVLVVMLFYFTHYAQVKHAQGSALERSRYSRSTDQIHDNIDIVDAERDEKNYEVDPERDTTADPVDVKRDAPIDRVVDPEHVETIHHPERESTIVEVDPQNDTITDAGDSERDSTIDLVNTERDTVIDEADPERETTINPVDPEREITIDSVGPKRVNVAVDEVHPERDTVIDEVDPGRETTINPVDPEREITIDSVGPKRVDVAVDEVHTERDTVIDKADPERETTINPVDTDRGTTIDSVDAERDPTIHQVDPAHEATINPVEHETVIDSVDLEYDSTIGPFFSEHGPTSDPGRNGTFHAFGLADDEVTVSLLDDETVTGTINTLENLTTRAGALEDINSCGGDISTYTCMENTCRGRCGQMNNYTNAFWLCSCDAACLVYGDCCKDYNDACGNRTFNIEMKEPFVCKQIGPGQYVYMKQSCRPDFTDVDVIQKCYEESGLEGAIPVTDGLTNVVYVNYFCAMCNMASENAVPWKIEMRCQMQYPPQLPVSDSAYFIDLCLNRVESRDCGRYLPNEGSKISNFFAYSVLVDVISDSGSVLQIKGDSSIVGVDSVIKVNGTEMNMIKCPNRFKLVKNECVLYETQLKVFCKIPTGSNAQNTKALVTKVITEAYDIIGILYVKAQSDGFMHCHFFVPALQNETFDLKTKFDHNEKILRRSFPPVDSTSPERYCIFDDDETEMSRANLVEHQSVTPETPHLSNGNGRITNAGTRLLSAKQTVGTIDLNIHELEMVANHLSIEECRKLSEALHMTHFRLDHPVTGKNEPKMGCLDLLLHWDSHEGRGKTFHDLAIRLNELGHKDLGDKLSRAVYHEQSFKVHKYFLDDPFKEKIHHDSKLLDEDDDDDAVEVTTKVPQEKDDAWTWFHTLGVATAVFSFLFITIFIYVKCIPEKYKCKCCHPCYTRCRKSFYQNIVGAKKVPEDEKPFLIL
ncbi:unnamed protein product [Owenia fusiformis]|uniref:SMB domain-containing protein n=1 Tax=Owenia fusiformis TaxID=6347 RepID=A0A8S4Q5A5_OWEFU|nr:unnamed protein product [Owenia fusiformis]